MSGAIRTLRVMSEILIGYAYCSTDAQDLHRAARLVVSSQDFDVVDNDHDGWRLGPSSFRKEAEGAQGIADTSHGRDDGQGQQHLHHLPPVAAVPHLNSYFSP